MSTVVMSSAPSGSATVTEVPAASMPVATSITVTSTVTSLTYSTSGSGPVRTPSQDPRVGWMYDLKKDELILEMSRLGLQTDGKSADLRTRFAAYWKEQARLGADSVPTTESASDLGRSGARREPRPTHDQQLVDELANIREILQLSPNADFSSVRRTLASLVHTARDPSRVEWGNHWGEGPQQPIIPPPVVSAGRFREPLHFERPNLGTFGFSIPERPRQVPRVEYQQNDRSVAQQLFPRAPNFGGWDEGFNETSTSRDCSSICNLVRKWGLKFDGRRDPVAFLERLSELAESYSVSRDELLKAMPELLVGTALLWYRNNKDLLHNYESFRSLFEIQFLPPGYRRNLDEEIRKRTQGEQESFRDFVTAISTLIRRNGTLSKQASLDVIYNNMRPDYKLLVRRQDCGSLAEMMDRAEDFEAYLREKSAFRPPPRPEVALVPETAYTPKRRADRYDSAAVGAVPPTPPGSPRAFKSYQSEKRGKPLGGQTGPSKVIDSKPEMEATYHQNDEKGDRGAAERKAAGQVYQSPVKARARCFRCRELGHFARNCRERLRCFGCGALGVTVAQCGCRAGNGRPTQAKGGHLS